MTKTFATAVPPELRTILEAHFQNGGGRAQVRLNEHPHNIVRDFEMRKSAVTFASADRHAVYWRSKVLGERRYEWQRVQVK